MPFQTSNLDQSKQASQNSLDAKNEGSRFGWGLVAVVALPVICCASPAIVAALAVVGPAILAIIGVEWPIALTLALVLLLAVFGLRSYLIRQGRSSKTSITKATSPDNGKEAR